MKTTENEEIIGSLNNDSTITLQQKTEIMKLTYEFIMMEITPTKLLTRLKSIQREINLSKLIN
jgi:hypothetical protein